MRLAIVPRSTGGGGGGYLKINALMLATHVAITLHQRGNEGKTCARAAVAAGCKWTGADCSAALSVGVQRAVSSVQLCIMFLAPKLNRAQAQFICETQTQMISEPPEVFVRKWISTGCLVNMRGESYEILTEQLGEKS